MSGKIKLAMDNIDVNPFLELAFQNFTVDGEIIPISFMNCAGRATKYLTYCIWSEPPKQFNDDLYNSEN
jgi:hypothetical protein